jgi:hypothetical protein
MLLLAGAFNAKDTVDKADPRRFEPASQLLNITIELIQAHPVLAVQPER